MNPEDKRGVPAAEYAAVAPDVKLGKGVKLGRFINLYGCEIGDETKIGAFVEIQKNASVGRRCKIRRAIIDKNVDIPPGMTIGYNLDEDRRRFFVTTARC